jgi:hypothetical protein
MQEAVSGEVTASRTNVPLGAAAFAGRVSAAWFSVEESGKDDSNDLYLEMNVKINGTTCLSTKAKIAHVSGESSMQKTTVVTGDTGVTQAVVDNSANSCSIGDIITYDLELTRTASPTTEMSTPSVAVELEPIF